VRAEPGAGAAQLRDEQLHAARVLAVQVGEAAAGLKEVMRLVFNGNVEDSGEEQERVRVLLVAEQLELRQDRLGLAAAGHGGGFSAQRAAQTQWSGAG